MSYDSFGYKFQQTVYKWWCVVYRPAYKLVHKGYWPEEKEPFYAANKAKEEEAKKTALAASLAAEARYSQSVADTVEKTLAESKVSQPVAPTPAPSVEPVKEATPDASADEIPADVSSDVLDRANEIMARLAREAAEDEAKKQNQIDEAKRKAMEQQRLDEILNSTKVDISSYIEQGKSLEQHDKEEKAMEQQRLDEILNSTKVDISSYIQQGKTNRDNLEL